MSEQTHTPGPWFTSQPHGTIYIEARLQGSTLQEVAACGPTETEGQREANARLIAAAPELLAALQYALDALAHCAADQGFSTMQSKAAQMANAAIRKAGGKS
jgi:hypothetical protein